MYHHHDTATTVGAIFMPRSPYDHSICTCWQPVFLPHTPVAPFKVAVGAETQKKWQMCWEKVIEAETIIL